MGNGLAAKLIGMDVGFERTIADLMEESLDLFLDMFSSADSRKVVWDSAKEDTLTLIQLGVLGYVTPEYALRSYFRSLPERAKQALISPYNTSAYSALANPANYRKMYAAARRHLSKAKNYVTAEPGIRYLLKQGFNVRDNIIYDGNTVIGHYLPRHFIPSFAITNDEYWRDVYALERLGYPVARRMNNPKP